MKTKLILLLAILMTSLSFSQSKGINYKALIKDSAGNVLANATITVEFNILQGSGMTSVYQESHSATSGSNGIIIVNIGEGALISGNYDTIDWASEAHFLNVQMDSGAGLTNLGTTEFKAVPYALNAASKIDDLTDGKSDSDGTENGSSIFLGIDAGLNDNGNDNNNIGIGFNALYNNTSGVQNIAIGHSALFNNTTGNANNANGYIALYNNTTGAGNMAHGNLALYNNTIGRDNSAFGYASLINNISGNQNNAFGSSSLNANTTGLDNNAFGYWALFSNTTGNENTAIGNEALYSNITGSENTAQGYQALFSNTQAHRNVANGYKALYNITTGGHNTAVGYQSLFSSNEGTNNTAIGYGALENNVSGTNNTAIGDSAGSANTLGDNNVFIGSFAGAQEIGSGKLYIENRSHDADGALIYGDFGINILRTNGEFQIGNPTLTGFAFPTSDGTANQMLQTNGNGALAWVDNSGTNASGLETLDEGNGIGWRLIGRDPANYGNIGLNAVDFSYSTTPSTTGGASGDYSTALGILYSTASGYASLAAGSYTTASGIRSTAMGSATTASGTYSTAMGINTESIGDNSTSMGYFTEASGETSTSMGYQSTASGEVSTAIGFYTLADDNYSTVVGQYNDNTTSTNTLFQVGNGNGISRSNAFSVDQDGIITAPSFDISEITDAKALITKEYADANYSGGGSGTEPTGLEAIDEGNGIGWRLIGIDPDNYGTIGEFAIDLSTSIDPSTTAGATGTLSLAVGDGAEASATGSIAIGNYSSSINSGSIAIGIGTTATGANTISIGKNTIASGTSAMALGLTTIASNSSATAIGSNTTASGVAATATGSFTTAQGWYSFTSGSNTLATESHSVAMGQATIASGFYSFAMGDQTKAEALGTTAIGHFNVGGGTPNAMIATDPLFEIGNGTSDIARNNALTVFRNGNATLAGTLTQNSDRRLKTNITELQYGLNTILKLNPVSYNWKKYPEITQKSLGLIAQEVQPLINEIVKVGIDKDQTLSLSYTELIPILIKAIQEQQDLINNQEKQIEGLSAELIKFKEIDQRLKRLEALNTNTLEK